MGINLSFIDSYGDELCHRNEYTGNVEFLKGCTVEPRDLEAFINFLKGVENE